MKYRIASAAKQFRNVMPGTKVIKKKLSAGTANPTTAIAFSGSLPNCRASTAFDSRVPIR